MSVRWASVEEAEEADRVITIASEDSEAEDPWAELTDKHGWFLLFDLEDTRDRDLMETAEFLVNLGIKLAAKGKSLVMAVSCGTVWGKEE